MDAQREYSIELGGRTLTIGVGLLAQQANASCTVRYGDTVTLCAATMGTSDRLGIDYFPLMVDYEERLYAAGRIKGSRFIKREGRPTDEAVLSGRLIDRAIRPLFDETIRREVQVVATVLSHDQANDADVPSLIGASCALMISDIPWNGPIAAVRVGRGEAGWILNPTYEEIAAGGMELVVAGTAEKTIMVEAGCVEIPEAQMIEAMAFASASLGPIIDLIKKVAAAEGKKKWDPAADATPEQIESRQKAIDAKARAFRIMDQKAQEILWSRPLITKADRKGAYAAFKAHLSQALLAEGASKDEIKQAEESIKEFINAQVTRAIIEDGRRIDGRKLNEIRPLSSAVALLPRTHGSGLFNRGETQVLSAVTLGSPGMEQTIDTMEYQEKRRYFHHYNFPGYSVGEAKSNRGPGRREIGHGALAERALIGVLPTKEDFPYTIRVVSEVLGSNGSSSMASTCGSTLSLMDAGVPIKSPVGGIAMGIALDESTMKYNIITDLQDTEDGKGGMDFKITGTRNGITAIQMDTKTSGLTGEMVKKTLTQVREALNTVLDNMAAVISAPRADLSPYAPRIESFMINPDKIRDVIGPGGKMINEIIAETGVQIDIEDSGLVMVTSVNAEGMRKAVDWIHNLTREVKAGEMFEGTVTRLMDFGAFVEVLPKQEGLVHISELAPERVATVQDVVKVGDKVKVKVIEIDSMGRINLSMKRARPDYVDNGEPIERRAPRPAGGGGGFNRGGGRGPRR